MKRRRNLSLEGKHDEWLHIATLEVEIGDLHDEKGGSSLRLEGRHEHAPYCGLGGRDFAELFHDVKGGEIRSSGVVMSQLHSTILKVEIVHCYMMKREEKLEARQKI